MSGRSNRQDEDFELSFVISGADVKLEFEDGFFNDEEEKELSSRASELSQKVFIDRSNVACKLNKHSKKFLLEEGWNFLHDVLVDTKYGKYMALENQKYIAQTLDVMICCYVMSELEAFTDKIEHIALSIDESSVLEVLICKDTSNEWSSYRGSWTDIDEEEEKSKESSKRKSKRRKSPRKRNR